MRTSDGTDQHDPGSCGNGNCSLHLWLRSESRSQLRIWSIVKSPLVGGCLTSCSKADGNAVLSTGGGPMTRIVTSGAAVWSKDRDERFSQWRRMIPGLIGRQVRIESGENYELHRSVAGVYSDQLSDESGVILVSSQNSLQALDAIVIHELTHAALSAVKPSSKDSDAARATIKAPAKEWQHRPFPWVGHGADFIRCLAHLRHRLENRGIVVESEQIYPHELYDVSSLDSYTDALKDEPERLSWLSLTEAMSRPIPAEFLKLWGSDVAASVKRSLFER